MIGPDERLLAYWTSRLQVVAVNEARNVADLGLVLA